MIKGCRKAQSNTHCELELNELFQVFAVEWRQNVPGGVCLCSQPHPLGSRVIKRQTISCEIKLLTKQVYMLLWLPVVLLVSLICPFKCLITPKSAFIISSESVLVYFTKWHEYSFTHTTYIVWQLSKLRQQKMQEYFIA